MPGQFKLKLMTPDQVFVDQPVDFVTLPAVDGVIQVSPGRWPLVTALAVESVEYWSGNKSEQIAIQGGIALFRDGVLYVLTAACR